MARAVRFLSSLKESGVLVHVTNGALEFLTFLMWQLGPWCLEITLQENVVGFIIPWNFSKTHLL